MSVAKWVMLKSISVQKAVEVSKQGATQQAKAVEVLWVWKRPFFAVFWFAFYWKELSTPNNLHHYRKLSETGDWQRRVHTPLFQLKKKKKKRKRGRTLSSFFGKSHKESTLKQLFAASHMSTRRQSQTIGIFDICSI